MWLHASAWCAGREPAKVSVSPLFPLTLPYASGLQHTESGKADEHSATGGRAEPARSFTFKDPGGELQ